jgi:hypothetical protein
MALPCIDRHCLSADYLVSRQQPNESAVEKGLEDPKALEMKILTTARETEEILER